MSAKYLTARLIRSAENPLLDIRSFHRHCQSRFGRLPMEHAFQDLLRVWAVRGLMRPICRFRGTLLYSSFQVWQVDHLLDRKPEEMPPEHPWFRGFGQLLLLLVRIQDHYLPEVRSNLRTGFRATYSGYACIRTTYLLSSLRHNRSNLIRCGRFDPARELAAAGITGEQLLEWIEIIARYAKSIDPIEPWRDLVRFISYDQRQKLRGKALVAQDLYEVCEALTLFSRDLGLAGARPILLDWQDHQFKPTDAPRTETPWEIEAYGREGLAQPYTLLEYLTNEFDLNPKPRAIIFTEGLEFRGLRRLFLRLGIDPDLLGVEFRSLHGGGNFSLDKWQGFIEYMHEKQVLVYFVLDRENNVEPKVKKILGAKRMSRVPHLEWVMPGEDRDGDRRIFVWKESFEEEFTNKVISLSLAEQGVVIAWQKIAATRRKKPRRGLISALSVDVDKGRLSESLIDRLILVGPNGKRGRLPSGPEKFVWTCAQLIILNNQPVDAMSRTENFKTGGLG